MSEVIGAMPVVFTELFENEHGKKFGISKDMVRQAFAYPDKEQKLLAPGLEIRLYAKKIDSRYLLVESDIRRGVMHINGAYWLKFGLVDEAQTPEPIALLKELASRYGLEIRVGHEKGKFIYNAMIPVATSNLQQIVSVVNPQNHKFVQSMWLKIVQGQAGFIAQVSLAYCIDTIEYVKALANDF